MGVLQAVWLFVRGFLAGRAALMAENLALRHQLAVLQRSVKRAKLRKRDRISWVWLSRLWSAWRSALLIVQPATVVKWHRQGFKLYWRWRSRQRKPGRPQVDPPSQTWRTFLENHAGQIAAVDFFTVPTVRFRMLYVFLVLRHDRRYVVHFNVTTSPTAQWAAHTRHARTCRWSATRRFPGPSARRSRARWSLGRTWAACTTAIRARPSGLASVLSRLVCGRTLRHARDLAIVKRHRHPQPLRSCAHHGRQPNGQASQAGASCADDVFGRDRGSRWPPTDGRDRRPRGPNHRLAWRRPDHRDRSASASSPQRPTSHRTAPPGSPGEKGHGSERAGVA